MSRPIGGDADLWVRRGCRIPAAELSWRFDTSGGPGGQHANTSRTRAELRFDVEGSQALSPAQRRRLLERLGPSVTVIVADTRSRARNRELARERLAGRLAAALAPDPKPRRPTRAHRGAREARLDAKRRRGEVKRDRRPPEPE